MTTSPKPAKEFRIGTISVQLWPTRDRFGRRSYATTITRNAGDGSETAPIRACDLPTIRSATGRAQAWIEANPLPNEAVRVLMQHQATR